MKFWITLFLKKYWTRKVNQDLYHKEKMKMPFTDITKLAIQCFFFNLINNNMQY